MPYCLLLMTYQSIRVVGGDEQVIQVRVDRVLRERLLPSIENVVPLDF